MQIEQFIHDMSEGYRLAARGYIGFSMWTLRTFAENQRDLAESMTQITQEGGRHLASMSQNHTPQHQPAQRASA
jgi:hypothetical protein